jgi:hypothetical protein
LKKDSEDTTERLLGSFDELIDPNITPVFLGALQTSIFRRVLWVEASQDVHVSDDNFKNLETVFPHAVILARVMRTKKVFYIGDPLLVVGDGARPWMMEYPMVANIRLLELLDYYQSLGVDPKRIRSAQASIIIVCTPYIVALSFIKKGIGHKYVEYRQSIARFISFKEFWLSFLLLPIYRLRAMI